MREDAESAIAQKHFMNGRKLTLTKADSKPGKPNKKTKKSESNEEGSPVKEEIKADKKTKEDSGGM